MSKLDLPKIERLLEELNACDEAIADRGPWKVLPREMPDVPRLQARMAEIHGELDVRRKNVLVPKGHDLYWSGAEYGPSPTPIDLKAIGIIEQVQRIAKGSDRALPTTDVIVRVRFPNGDHRWFDPDDLTTIEEDEKEAAKKAAKAKAAKPKPAGTGP